MVLDTTFGPKKIGIVATQFASLEFATDNWATSVAVQTDGKIIVAGYSFTNGYIAPSILVVARYDSDGTLDQTFGNSGSVFAGSFTKKRKKQQCRPGGIVASNTHDGPGIRT